MTDTSSNDLQAQVDEAVELREKHGEVERAVQILNLVIPLAESYQFFVVLRNALAQRIVCNKHFFRLHGKEAYLSAMQQDCMHGLTLNLHASHRAVFYFRGAEAQALGGDLINAAKNYKRALADVHQNSREHAEILSSQAEFLADMNRMEDATHAFQRALLIFNQLRGSMAESDWLTLQSGLYARLAKTAVNAGDRMFGVQCLGKALQLACWLCIRWGNRQRLVLLCYEVWAELEKRFRRRTV